MPKNATKKRRPTEDRLKISGDWKAAGECHTEAKAEGRLAQEIVVLMRKFAFACIACFWLSASALAVHVTPQPVHPLIVNGVHFTIPHDAGRRGYVQAWDAQ